MSPSLRLRHPASLLLLLPLSLSISSSDSSRSSFTVDWSLDSSSSILSSSTLSSGSSFLMGGFGRLEAGGDCWARALSADPGNRKSHNEFWWSCTYYKRKTSHTWGSVDVPSVLEKVVRLYVNEVWGKVPNVLAVVDDAYHMIPTWK